MATPETHAPERSAVRSNPWLDSDCITAAASGDAVASQRRHGRDDSSLTPYYEDSAVTIYHGDCRDVMPGLAPVDLVLTSPPYNLGNTTGGGFPGVKQMGHYDASAPMGAKRGGMGKWAAAAKKGGLAHGYGVHGDAMPHDQYVEWQHDVLKACWRVLNENGAIYYNHKTRVLDGIAVTPLTYNPGLPVRQIVVWARAGGVNFSPAFYLPTHEWILILAKPDFRLRDKAASGAGDVWYIPQETDTQHPAPFPLRLALQALQTTASKVVLDPFMGSGTTLRAAKDLGRKAIGIEINERYCEIAAKRMSQEVLNFTPSEPHAADLGGVRSGASRNTTAQESNGADKPHDE